MRRQITDQSFSYDIEYVRDSLGWSSEPFSVPSEINSKGIPADQNAKSPIHQSARKIITITFHSHHDDDDDDDDYLIRIRINS